MRKDVAAARQYERQILALFDRLDAGTTLKASEVREKVGGTKAQLRAALARLKSEGEVESQGWANSAVWSRSTTKKQPPEKGPAKPRTRQESLRDFVEGDRGDGLRASLLRFLERQQKLTQLVAALLQELDE